MGKMQIRHIVAAVCALIVSCTAVPVAAETAATEQADSFTEISVARQSEIDETEGMIAGGYIADDVEVPAFEEEVASRKLRRSRAAAVIPASYDARDMGYVTPVKTQQNNTCWAYSAISMAESDLIAGGDLISGHALTKDTADFSEDHLVYAFYHGTTANPLGDYRDVGGNHIFTTFGFANWVGLAEETQTNGINWESETVDLSQISQSAHMQNAYWINLKQNPGLVKRMILQHGSAAISMYYVGYYMNPSEAAYYNDTVTSVNHAVAIVGWDDDYPAANFKKNPGTNGAWLAKNSYGTSATGEGYFWISYQDAALNSNTAKAFIFDFEAADEYDYIYRYDNTAGAYMESGAGDTGYRVSAGKSIANVFTVPTDTQTGYQTLEAVSVALFAVNVDYSVQIYKNPTKADRPDSGTPLLETPVTGKTSYVGYYTISLPIKPVIKAGDSFSVVITVSKSNGAAVSYFVDKTYKNGNWISFEHQAKEGQSFAQSDDGWVDLSQTGATARIKAFTSDYLVPSEGIQIGTPSVTMWNGQTTQLVATVVPENASYTTPQWKCSDPSVASVDENGCVTAVTEGTVVITASAKDNPAVYAECTVTVRQQAEEVRFAKKVNYECKVGKTIQPQLSLQPENASWESISFASSDESVATVDEDGTIHGKRVGTAVITVYSSVTQQNLASCEIKVLPAEGENTEQKPEDPKNGSGIKKEPEESGQPALPEQEETVAATGSRAVRTDDNSGIYLWIGIGIAMLALMRITTRASSR